MEGILIYSAAFVLCGAIVWVYLSLQRKKTKKTLQKIEQAKMEGLHEPVSLHPVVDYNSCIGTGACIAACPEKDILGMANGKATLVNASRCIGHGACFHACPTQAITLVIGTEKRGVELPHINKTFETNVPGIYIAGELGGMGLIKNAVEQGRQAVENIAHSLNRQSSTDYDLIVVGAGPAGISASLEAKKRGLKCVTLEQDSLGGAVFTFPRAKIVMTSAMELPLYGRIKLVETNKPTLLKLWLDVLQKNDITVWENTKVEHIAPINGNFDVLLSDGRVLRSKCVLLAIGRRGSPRKLGIPGELQEKVSYRLLEPELFLNRNIMVIGGGDSAIESAILLCDNNTVHLSYRGDAFSRIKPKNSELITRAVESGRVKVWFNTNVKEIGETNITLVENTTHEEIILNNDQVFIFAGGELPTQFLMKAGITITKKFGEAILKHNS